MESHPTRPVMFTCANQVSVIEVGADEVELKQKTNFPSHRTSGSYLSKRRDSSDDVSKSVIRRVSTGLNFTDEVI